MGAIEQLVFTIVCFVEKYHHGDGGSTKLKTADTVDTVDTVDTEGIEGD